METIFFRIAARFLFLFHIVCCCSWFPNYPLFQGVLPPPPPDGSLFLDTFVEGDGPRGHEGYGGDTLCLPCDDLSR